MRKRTRVALAIVAVACFGGFACFMLRSNEPEPSYQGKPLSVWLEDIKPRAYMDFTPETKTAVDHIGTNGIPTLLKILRRRDSPLRTRLIVLARRFPGIGRLPWIKAPLFYSTSMYIKAALAFEVLGSRGRSAVPDLIEIYDQNLSPMSQMVCIRILGQIGSEAKTAVPVMLRDAASTNEYVRIQAIVALGKIHAEPQRVVPVLVKALQDPSQSVQNMALLALQEFGEEARPAIPALIAILEAPHDTPDTEMKFSLASQVLRKIDPAAAAKAGVGDRE